MKDARKAFRFVPSALLIVQDSRVKTTADHNGKSLVTGSSYSKGDTLCLVKLWHRRKAGSRLYWVTESDFARLCSTPVKYIKKPDDFWLKPLFAYCPEEVVYSSEYTELRLSIESSSRG